MSSMTIKDLSAACAALAKEVGPKADVTIFVNDNGQAHGGLYPRGMGLSAREDGYLSVGGDTWDEVLANLRAKWETHAAEHRKQVIRKMAALVIRHTADHGACTDAQLRVDFHPGEVERYGAEAVEEANRIAATGPFAIVAAGGSNLIAAE